MNERKREYRYIHTKRWRHIFRICSISSSLRWHESPLDGDLESWIASTTNSLINFTNSLFPIHIESMRSFVDHQNQTISNHDNKKGEKRKMDHLMRIKCRGWNIKQQPGKKKRGERQRKNAKSWFQFQVDTETQKNREWDDFLFPKSYPRGTTMLPGIALNRGSPLRDHEDDAFQSMNRPMQQIVRTEQEFPRYSPHPPSRHFLSFLSERWGKAVHRSSTIHWKRTDAGGCVVSEIHTGEREGGERGWGWEEGSKTHSTHRTRTNGNWLKTAQKTGEREREQVRPSFGRWIFEFDPVRLFLQLTLFYCLSSFSFSSPLSIDGFSRIPSRTSDRISGSRIPRLEGTATKPFFFSFFLLLTIFGFFYSSWLFPLFWFPYFSLLLFRTFLIGSRE